MNPLFETEPLQRGLFLERPNRFVVRYRKGARRGTAYIANPGRMGEILLPGTELLLARRLHTRTGVEAVGATWKRRWSGDRPRSIYLNTGRINDLAERLLQERKIPELARYRIERREFTVGRSRFDFLLTSGTRRYLLEVKSVTLVEEGLALFPDAKTDRGTRHLKELAHVAAQKGWRSGVLFIVQGGAQRFLPDFHNDPKFARTLRSVRGKVDLLPYRMEPSLRSDRRLVFQGSPRRLPIPWDRLEAGLVDGGLYLLAVQVPKALRLEVGALGRLAFRRGHYVYVGSARRGLSARVDRHLRRRKRLHWHIDFLRAQSPRVRGYPIRGASGECKLAKSLAGIGSGEVDGFGSSDCSCRSHLIYFPEDPWGTAPFQQLLTGLRHRLRVKGSRSL